MSEISHIEDSSRSGRIGTLLTLGAVIVTALVLRGYHLNAQSYSMDEVIELSITCSSASEIILEPDGFPPLYHLILKAWNACTGDILYSRWLSVLAGLAAVLFTGMLGKAVGGTRVGLAAAGLLAVSPLHIFFSQETRAYSLYVALVTLALWLFFEAWKTDAKRYWAGFAVAIVAACFTHYYSGLLAAFLGVFFLACRGSWSEKRRGLIAFLVAAIACFPAVWLLRIDHSFQSIGCMYTPFDWRAWGYSVYASLAGFSLGASLSEMHALAPIEIMRQAIPWIVSIACSAGWLGYAGWKELAGARSRLAILLLALAAIPVIGFLGELASVGYKVRYVSWTIVPLCVLLGAGIASEKKAARTLTVVATLVLVSLQLLSTYQRAHNPRYANEEISAVADHMNLQGSQRNNVFVLSDYMYGPVKFYLNNKLIRDPQEASDWPIYELPQSSEGRASLDKREPIDKAIADMKQIASAGPFWLVYTRSFHGDPQGKFLAALQAEVELEETQFTGAVLYQGRFAPSSEQQ
ncbi:glycosyltransferase family 39 protein [Adhaeretor mobilis]|uniref:Glycosyltransferase RgtA/B/C/D-like domain-containing protein n=1 Tax=Adhaeretor mobilis TaxID=1930276 RepID=A0A517MVV3_9BACT|nr:glycosyltransferase family 39 protein [Adhaeretor mobilis]QDS99009.1 hypothetical protein HG15A2_22980 [Adhaeretor mobilis]